MCQFLFSFYNNNIAIKDQGFNKIKNHDIYLLTSSASRSCLLFPFLTLCCLLLLSLLHLCLLFIVVSLHFIIRQLWFCLLLSCTPLPNLLHRHWRRSGLLTDASWQETVRSFFISLMGCSSWLPLLLVFSFSYPCRCLLIQVPMGGSRSSGFWNSWSAINHQLHGCCCADFGSCEWRILHPCCPDQRWYTQATWEEETVFQYERPLVFPNVWTTSSYCLNWTVPQLFNYLLRIPS